MERSGIARIRGGGRRCIRGYRMRVSDVLDLIAAEASNEEILGDYPFLEAEGTVAVVRFAANQTDHAVSRVAREVSL